MSKTKPEYIIDGSKFRTQKGFYDYIESMFTFNLGWAMGRNLDAFNDILYGGFGRHEYREKIIVKWKNYKLSEKRLQPKFFRIIMEILEEHEEVEFYKFDFEI